MKRKYIGENIKTYRRRKDLTQRELADRIGKTWEMISRYERGISSPWEQIDTLADALEIEVADLLGDPNVKRFDFNRVPLFTSIPKDMDFKNTKSYVYYTVPDWVLDMDRDCFVLDGNLVEGVKKNSYFYVSPNIEFKDGDLVLIERNGKVYVEDRDIQEGNVLGRVLGQEIRFV